MKSEQFVLLFFAYLTFIYFILFISNQGKQHKMLEKRHVATGWLQTVCVIYFLCKVKVSNFIILDLIGQQSHLPLM